MLQEPLPGYRVGIKRAMCCHYFYTIHNGYVGKYLNCQGKISMGFSVEFLVASEIAIVKGT